MPVEIQEPGVIPRDWDALHEPQSSYHFGTLMVPRLKGAISPTILLHLANSHPRAFPITPQTIGLLRLWFGLHSCVCSYSLVFHSILPSGSIQPCILCRSSSLFKRACLSLLCFVTMK